MKVTSRGWSVLGITAGLYAAGRVLGAVELSMLAAGGVGTVAAALVLARVRRPRVQLRRTIRPARLHAGTPARADLDLVNRGGRWTPVLAVTDSFAGRREARFSAPPLAPSDLARAAYRIPTGRRGVFPLGPLTIGVTDPLGLLRRSLDAGSREEVTVYPRVDAISPLPMSAGHDFMGGAVDGWSRSRAGEEFHTLRPYQTGDDLRRVHWRSTARTGDLMIREDDVPWQLRATVLLDTRRPTHTEHTFERAVEAAASVVASLAQRRALFRLVTTDGLDLGFGSGFEHERAAMERLAAVQANGDDRFDAAAARLHRQAGPGALVAVVGNPRDDDLLRIGALGRRFGVLVAVQMLAGHESPVPTPGAVGVAVRPGEPFAGAWNEAMARWRTVRSSPR